MSRNDKRHILTSRFSDQNRYHVFGSVIRKVTLEGFRCHGVTSIDIKSPIMAFSGLNGTGKSTLLQILAVAYRSIAGRSYSINDFFAENQLDSDPISDGARITFEFETGRRRLRPLTLSKPSSTRRRREWNGQRRRDHKTVYYAGVSEYIPKVEKPYYCNRARGIQVSNPQSLDNRSKEWICKILRQNYDEIHRYAVNIAGERNPFITHVSKHYTEENENGTEVKSVSYSEAHMGFGEARTIHMVATIEALPDGSLILLEEPETSLHPSAQYTFGEYLVDVVLEKKHQVFLTTHSDHIQQAFPSSSNCFLHKTNERKIRPIYTIMPSQSRSLLTNGSVIALTVLVEDDCAKAVVEETLRIEDELFLRTVQVTIGGSCERIKESLRGLKAACLNVSGVLDADQTSIPTENIFCLPGSLPPEKEIFRCQGFVDFLTNNYAFRLEEFMTQMIGINHHSWFEKLADELRVDRRALLKEGSRCLAQSYGSNLRNGLVTQLRSAISK